MRETRFRRPGRKAPFFLRIPLSLLVLVFCAATIAWRPSLAAAAPPAAGLEQRFTDSAGQIHTWTISPSQTLIWDRKPWVPVGAIFCFHFLARWNPNDPTENEARWKSDVQVLQTIRLAGVRDLLVTPGVPATALPVGVWQRALDQLERMGFHYGIQINDGPSAPLRGYLLRGSPEQGLAAKSDARPGVSLQLSFALPGELGSMPQPVGALVLFLDSASGKVLTASRIEGGMVLKGSIRYALTLPAEARSGVDVSLVPEIQCAGLHDARDVWAGLDEYASRLDLWLRGPKLGPGFRFIADPVGDDVLLGGVTETVKPNGRAFLEGYEAWLKGTYAGRIEVLRAAWGVTAVAGAPEDFAQAAALVPLRRGRAGTSWSWQGYAMDPGGGGVAVFDARVSKIWSDLASYRDSSFRGVIQRIADKVKTVSNVPVIATQQEEGVRPHFVNARGDGSGLDGVATAVSGNADRDPVLDGLAFGLAEARASARPLWALATGLPDLQPPEGIGKGPSLADRAALEGGLESIVRGGARGVFLSGVRSAPREGGAKTDVAREPRELEWAAEARDSLERDPDWPRLIASRAQIAVSFPDARRGVARMSGESGPSGEGGCAPWPTFRLPGGLLCVPSSEPIPAADLALVRGPCLGSLTTPDRIALRDALATGWKRVLIAGIPPDQTGIAEIDSFFLRRQGRDGAGPLLALRGDSPGSRVLARDDAGRPLSIQSGRFVILADTKLGEDCAQWKQTELPRSLRLFDLWGVGAAATRTMDLIRRGSHRPETLVPRGFLE